MRISDWSSDVCSSDLTLGVAWNQAKQNPFRQVSSLAARALKLPPDRMNEKFVLALARAGNHNHLAPQAGGKVAAALNLVGRQRHIELEISRYPHSRRARLFQSLRIVQGQIGRAHV